MLNQIKEVIEQYDIICIYRHVFPDGDAKGSQFGLKTWIERKYPNMTPRVVNSSGVSDDKSFERVE